MTTWEIKKNTFDLVIFQTLSQIQGYFVIDVYLVYFKSLIFIFSQDFLIVPKRDYFEEPAAKSPSHISPSRINI